MLAPPEVLTRAQQAAQDTADRGLRRSLLAGAPELSAEHTPQLLPETLDSVMEPDADVLHDYPRPSGDLGMQASFSS